ncbi:hypothetical protein [Algirhabdus cladophorae]|uniref:hypothetical protein n=1 Tax=Algirhabdus cladophorae TaxID=3377108 RepID=UPI003B84776E
MTVRDRQSGDSGADTIEGKRETDLIRGGTEVFVFTRSSGHDVIIDLTGKQDLIDLLALALGSGDTKLDLTQIGDKGRLIISGLAAISFHDSDVIFD